MMRKLLMKAKINRQLALGAMCLAVIVGFAGCGSASKSEMTNDMAYDMAYGEAVQEPKPQEWYDGDAGLVESTTTTGADTAQTDVNRKLIKTVDMDVETKEFDAMLDSLDQQIAALGGYVEQMNTYNGSIYSSWRSARSASMTIRVPQDKLDTFLEAVTKIGNVIRRNDSVEDVTLKYVDLESHKEALQIEQERLLELLENAQSIEDIITLEQRLSTVRYQIESMESQLRTYDNLVSYSTVNLSIDEVKELTPVAEETVWERITGGFMGSLQDIGDDIVEIAIWLVVNSPYLLIWAAIIIIFIVVLRRSHIRRKKRLEAAMAKKSAEASVEDDNKQQLK